VTVLSSSPWVITIDDFLSESESATISDIIDELQEMDMQEKIDRVDQNPEDSNHEMKLINDRDSMIDNYFSGWCMNTCMDSVSTFIYHNKLFIHPCILFVLELYVICLFLLYSMKLYMLRISEWHH